MSMRSVHRKTKSRSTLNHAFEQLKSMMLSESTFRKKYADGFEWSELSTVLGDGVMSYSSWIEELGDIESRINKLSDLNRAESKAQADLLVFIEKKMKEYVQYRNYFSSNPRTFREVD